MELQLQSVLLPRKDVCGEKGLYIHKKGRQTAFDGYLNLFCIEKWKRYTVLDNLCLSMKLQGYERLTLYHDKKRIGDIHLQAEKTAAYQVPLPICHYRTGIFWFSLTEAPGVKKRAISGFYTCESETVRNVNIGAVVCTYHREKYIERSLELLRKYVIEKPELEVSSHVWSYLVDNGRTLQGCKRVMEFAGNSGNHTKVIPNRNAGGSGGFTRGMLQVLKEQEEKQLTHVLLMDDDIVMEPDLFVRAFGFLSIVKEEWKEITLGGSMLREDQPWMLHAAGEYWEKGIIQNPRKGADLRLYQNATAHGLLTAEYEKKYYSGWWCCIYSLRVVREDNLPMPVFLHHDDIEFGLRSRRYGIVFLHGICVWHRNFEDTPPGANLYYDIRNNLIELALQYPKEKAARYIWKFFWERLAVRIARLRQEEVFYVLRGAEDFLKGPGWLWRQNPEQLNQGIRTEKIPKMWKLACQSLGIFRRMSIGLRPAVGNYQQNMARYTNRRAWATYLNRMSGSEKAKPQ